METSNVQNAGCTLTPILIAIHRSTPSRGEPSSEPHSLRILLHTAPDGRGLALAEDCGS
jgi:hypothetical protein